MKELNLPAKSDVKWRKTWLTRLLRILPEKHHYTLAEHLVNEANALRLASPKDGYQWVDRREGVFKGMPAQEAANRIERSINA